MNVRMSLAVAALSVASPAFADNHSGGDAAAGEKEFRKCKSCHMIVDNEGNNIVRGGRVGPNLYGVIGRTAGSVEDFRYSDLLAAAGEAGLEWDEAEFAAYVQDPTGYLREYTGESSGRGKMAYKVRDEQDAMDLAAYLATFSDGTDDGGDG